MHSKLIVVEGIDGAGKSSCVLKLVEYLNKHHCPTLHTYEPYGSFITNTIYDVLYGRIPEPDPQVMATLFTAARMHHIEHIIKPALKEGLNVICDRYIFSTLAYNIDNNDTQDRIESDHQEFYCPPDHVFYLNCLPHIALERTMKGKNKQSIFDKDIDKLRAVSNQYASLFLLGHEEVVICGQPSLIHIIDANLGQDKVMKQIFKVIDPLIIKPFPSLMPDKI